MDFFLWSEVQRRMARQNPPRNESIAAYKLRMRRTAFILESVIRKAVEAIRTRASAVVDAEGGDIPRD